MSNRNFLAHEILCPLHEAVPLLTLGLYIPHIEYRDPLILGNIDGQIPYKLFGRCTQSPVVMRCMKEYLDTCIRVRKSLSRFCTRPMSWDCNRWESGQQGRHFRHRICWKFFDRNIPDLQTIVETAMFSKGKREEKIHYELEDFLCMRKSIESSNNNNTH